MTTSHGRILLGLLLGWLAPGLGHWFYGRRGKALLFFTAIGAAFAIGLWLGEGRVVHSVKFPLYLLAQMWAGGPALVTMLVTQDLRITGDIAQLDAGLLFTSVAGLLNVVVLVDLYEEHLKVKERQAGGAVATPRRAPA